MNFRNGFTERIVSATTTIAAAKTTMTPGGASTARAFGSSRSATYINVDGTANADGTGQSAT